MLGSIYAADGVPKDYTEAMEWWRKAAKQGHEKAQFALGLMYQTGKGVKVDDTESVKWYRKAAEQGNEDAQVSLGLMYGSGHVVSDGEAVKWLLEAAGQGRCEAQNMLGRLYYAGEVVAEDYVLAYMWFNLAAAQGDKDARECKAALVGFMAKEQIAEA